MSGTDVVTDRPTMNFDSTNKGHAALADRHEERADLHFPQARAGGPRTGRQPVLPHEMAGDEQHHHKPDQSRNAVHEAAQAGGFQSPVRGCAIVPRPRAGHRQRQTGLPF